MKLKDKWAIARCIDEGRPFPAPLAERVAGSSELSGYAEMLRTMESRLSAGALHQRPSPSLRGRTLASLSSAPTGGHVRAWALWSGAIAVFAVAGAALVIYLAPVQPREPTLDPSAVQANHAVKLPNVTDLLIQPFATATQSIRKPFQSEAEALKDDAQKTFGVILAQFPPVTGNNSKQ